MTCQSMLLYQFSSAVNYDWSTFSASGEEILASPQAIPDCGQDSTQYIHSRHAIDFAIYLTTNAKTKLRCHLITTEVNKRFESMSLNECDYHSRYIQIVCSSYIEHAGRLRL